MAAASIAGQVPRQTPVASGSSPRFGGGGQRCRTNLENPTASPVLPTPCDEVRRSARLLDQDLRRPLLPSGPCNREGSADRRGAGTQVLQRAGGRRRGAWRRSVEQVAAGPGDGAADRHGAGGPGGGARGPGGASQAGEATSEDEAPPPLQHAPPPTHPPPPTEPIRPGSQPGVSPFSEAGAAGWKLVPWKWGPRDTRPQFKWIVDKPVQKAPPPPQPKPPPEGLRRRAQEAKHQPQNEPGCSSSSLAKPPERPAPMLPPQGLHPRPSPKVKVPVPPKLPPRELR